MKTEKEFSNFFVESCQLEKDHTHAAYVIEISKGYWPDLTTHLSTYFSNEDRLEITKKAAKLLAENLKILPIDKAW